MNKAHNQKRLTDIINPEKACLSGKEKREFVVFPQISPISFIRLKMKFFPTHMGMIFRNLVMSNSWLQIQWKSQNPETLVSFSYLHIYEDKSSHEQHQWRFQAADWNLGFFHADLPGLMAELSLSRYNIVIVFGEKF